MSDWTGVHFNVNKSYWDFWGHECAYPFRISNLMAFDIVCRNLGLRYSLSGQTLKSAIEFNMFVPDHDDDLVLECSDSMLDTLKSELRQVGFIEIRKDKDFFSILRYNRYIDIYLMPVEVGKSVRLSGQNFPYDERLLANIDKNKKRNELRKVVTVFQERGVNYFSKKVVYHLGKQIKNSFKSTKRVKFLDYEEFLKLKIDEPQATNWTWRGRHLDLVGKPGMDVSQIIEFLTENIHANVDESDLTVPVVGPMNFSYDFWNRGNNFFINTVKYGFRHCVMPYNGAELYINFLNMPNLYSADYYQSLAPMTFDEIKTFLTMHPIHINRNNFIESGRHRIYTLIGRAVRGEAYIKVPYVKV